MKIIKPIVAISKIIDSHDAVLCGFNGVLYDGKIVNKEAMHALHKCAENGKEVIILTNSPLRVLSIIEILQKDSDLAFLSSVISAGEVLHYRIKDYKRLGLSGPRYYTIGNPAAEAVFAGTVCRKVSDLQNADFLYVGMPESIDDTLEKYMPVLEHGFALGLPLLCAGNDVSTYFNGEISLGAGTLAEQYAVMGGKILTFGKPDMMFLNYAIESFSRRPKNLLCIGDSFATDIKAGSLLNASSLLISKGIHVNFLGEGYIPDVEKARNLAMNFDAYPDYVISGLRW